jgi:chromate transporter
MPAGAGSVAEVFAAFLKLGVTSFGGPIAHLGYFHRELIQRRGWMDEARYAELLALCQFLPGPASSQLGFAMGLIRAGWLGALAAFVAFTLPSALLLVAFAHFLPVFDEAYGVAIIHGLKLLAVAVVGQGVLVMTRRLTPDVPRASIAIGAGVLVAVSGSSETQLVAVVLGAALGTVLCRHATASPSAPFELRHGTRTGALLIAGFLFLLLLSFLAQQSESALVSVAGAFYRAGALVFGGGHVVLPLLQESVVAPGWIPSDEFLAGYGAAQAVPGPMFSIAAFLGARVQETPSAAIGAVVAVIAIFLPGLLLVAGVLPIWRSVAGRVGAMRALAGVNAAVVGLLAAALYDPLWTGAILTPMDFAIALVAFVLLAATRVSILIVLAWCVLTSFIRM